MSLVFVEPAHAGEVLLRSVQPFGCLLSGMDVDDAEIWLKCKDDLFRYAAVLVGPGDAEDVVSTVFLRVLDRRRLDDLEDARRYLFRAVLNECKTRGVRRRTGFGPADLPVPPPPDPQPEILDAVLALPIGQRAATFFVYWADMSVAEAARMMGIQPGTVKRYLHLARNKLKGVLDEHVNAE
jgi:RNA polymerase sigma-70 factor (ECF subfamily)